MKDTVTEYTNVSSLRIYERNLSIAVFLCIHVHKDVQKKFMAAWVAVCMRTRAWAEKQERQGPWAMPMGFDPATRFVCWRKKSLFFSNTPKANKFDVQKSTSTV